jgi:hypothetical protein
MKRFQYRLNDQNTQLGTWGKLVPLKYVEVVPGDTISGTFKTKSRSAITVKPIYSRAYFDLYAFYVPYRILWADWKNFIQGTEGGVSGYPSFPTLAVQRPWNFETHTVGVGNNFLGDAYHHIWNRFFDLKSESGGNSGETIANTSATAGTMYYRPWNGTAMQNVYRRDTTFDQSLKSQSNVRDVDIDVSGPNITVSELREAFAQERWEKLRDFYGHRYVDYLAAVGVKANWEILDEPECIGVSNNDWQYRTVKSTTTESIARAQGYFESEHSINLRKTFCPEHGVIAIMAAPRADLFWADQGTHTAALRQSREDFYSPEFSMYSEQTVSNLVVGGSSDFVTPKYEEFRKGRNEIGDRTTDVMQTFLNPMTVTTEAALRATVPDTSAFEAEPAEPVQGQPYGLEIPIYGESRLTRVSPVTPMARKGVA